MSAPTSRTGFWVWVIVTVLAIAALVAGLAVANVVPGNHPNTRSRPDPDRTATETAPAGETVVSTGSDTGDDHGETPGTTETETVAPVQTTGDTATTTDDLPPVETDFLPPVESEELPPVETEFLPPS